MVEFNLGGGEGMQVEWNQCDDLTLARDQTNQNTVATFFNTRKNVVTENNI